MKKLFTLLFTVLSLSLFASFEEVEIAGASFTDSVAVPLGSQQWVDVRVHISTLQNGYIDSVKIYIVADTTGLPVLVRLFTEKYRFDFLNRAFNPDSLTRRIYITLPQSFNCTKFKIITGVESSPPKGKFEQPIPTAIEDIKASAEVRQINYYNLQGAVVMLSEVEASCIYIKEFIYTDGRVVRKKYLKTE